MTKKNNIKIFKPNDSNFLENLFVEDGISAGFPSPASDFEESRISLEKVVVKNKEATFYAKVSGESMKDAGLDDGDILVILAGGHGFKMLDKTKFVEIKQGPYQVPEDDKKYIKFN